MDPAGTSRIAKIILLHGTWGRRMFPKDKTLGSRLDDAVGKRWFEQGSVFRKSLEEKLDGLPAGSSIRWFSWSGANSVFERNVAAMKLAEELTADLADPRAVPVIVAHSHGGNVALRALSQVKGADRVKVVTMATPFLRVFARDEFKLPGMAWWLVYISIVALIFAAILFPVAYVLDRVGAMDRFGIAAIAAGVAALALGALVMRGITRRLSNSNRAREIQRAAEYDRVDASSPAMLVIRGVDDEAALSLAAGAIGSGLTRWLLFVAIPAVLGPLAFVWMFLGDRADSFMPFVYTGVAFVSLLFLVLAPLCKAAFGREFVGAAFVCEVAADSTPDASVNLQSITLSPIDARAGLRHSIYDHPQCADRVARWIREVV